MSNHLRRNILRAVRMLPQTVRIGVVPEDERADDETGAADVPVESETDHAESELDIARKEANVFRAQSVRMEKENAELLSRIQALEAEIAKLGAQVDSERRQMTAELESESRKLFERARSEGRAEGQKTGREEGLVQAKKEISAEYAQRFSALVSRLESVHETLVAQTDSLIRLLAPKVIRLWQNLLKRMLHKEAALDQETILRVFTGVLQRVSNKERIVVYLAPEDVDLLRDRQGEFSDILRGTKHLEFIADTSVDPGSCIVETNLGVYDARWRTQLEQIDSEIEMLFIEGIRYESNQD